MIRSLAVCTLAAALFGQEKAPPPAFEVASVKPTPSDSHDFIGLSTYPGGRIRATKYTLNQLIHEAWLLEPYQIVGGPRWADQDRFDVEAKPPEWSQSSKWMPESFKTAPNPEMRRMLQTLLADRFQLQVHPETRRESVYALVAAKGGTRLQPPQSTDAQPFVSYLPHGLRGQNATIDQLAQRLAVLLKRPVANRTGIDGHFDFLIDYPSDDAGTDLTVLLPAAMQEQVGLKLETHPGSVEVLVIDRAEKPAAN